MSASARRLKLLRHVVDNLDRVEFKPGPIGESDIPFIKGKIGPGFSVGIRKQAGESLVNLADEIFSGNSRYQRGTTFTSVYDQLSDLIIESCLGRASGEIEDVDVTLIEKEIDVWFNTKIGPRQLFVACLLSPTPGPPFSVGPVQFTYIDDFIPRSKTFSSGETFDLTFGHMFDEMRRDSASWIATVDVAECMEERAWELGELAVDIAIVGIQLVVPIGHSGRMARASARISPRVRSAISRAGTTVSVRGTNASPGRAMGPGALQHYLVQGAQVLQAVGPRIKVFLRADPRTC
jgi:hypothetical protein